MATKTLYLKNALAGTSDHLSLQDGGTAPGTVTTGTGWTVAKVALDRYSRMDSQFERASGSFGTVAQPDGVPDVTSGDCFRTENALNGDFASAAWDFAFPVIAVSSGGDQDGAIRIRMWRSVNQDGSSATEITAGTQQCSTVTNLTTGAAQTSSLTTFNPGAFTLTNEYLFVQVAWRITGAGGSNTRDVLLRVGSAARIITADFTEPGIIGTLNKTLGALAAAADGDIAVVGTLGKTFGVLTLLGDADVAIAGTLAKTLGAATLSAAGTVADAIITGSLVKTLGTLALLSEADVGVAGALIKTLGAATLGATGQIALQGALARTLGGMTLSGDGDVAAQGAVSRVLGALAAVSDGDIAIVGGLVRTLGILDLDGTGVTAPEIVGTLVRNLGIAALSAQARADVSGILQKILGGVTLSASGGLPWEYGEVVRFGNVTVTAPSIAGGVSSDYLAITGPRLRSVTIRGQIQ